jgi:TPR repeat protein
VEHAIKKLYQGQTEENFWGLINALNYALEMDTEVLVPVDAMAAVPDGADYWAETPIPEQKAQDLRYWTLHADEQQNRNKKIWLPVFTHETAAKNDRSTAARPMAQKKLRAMMELVLGSEHIDGMVIDPWSQSASLERALLRGLLRTGAENAEGPGAAYLKAGHAAARRGDWNTAAEQYRLSAEECNPEGQRMLGLCYRNGRGVRRSNRMALRWLNAAAEQEDLRAQILVGDMYATGEHGGEPDRGLALLAYRRAFAAAEQEPDIDYWPEICLRLAQYEVCYTSREEALHLALEARHGLQLRYAEGDVWAQEGLEQAERLCRELAQPVPAQRPTKSAYSTEPSHLD